jgi:hypothetical protein
MKKFTLSELGNLLFERQVEDDTLSQAMSHYSLIGYPTGLELEKSFSTSWTDIKIRSVM